MADMAAGGRSVDDADGLDDWAARVEAAAITMRARQAGRMAMGVVLLSNVSAGRLERQVVSAARDGGKILVMSMRTLFRAGLLLLCAMTASAQSIAGAVLAKHEPHHHLVYEDSTIRVLRVRVPAHDTTLLHEHDPDYFWVALDASTVVNVKPGSPDANITSGDLSFHYTFGKFAHIARNPGATPFDNITVELLEPQADPRNLCEPARADTPLDCPPPSSGFFSGAVEHPALTTAQLRVSLLTISAGGTLQPGVRTKGAWLITVDSADAGRGLVIEGQGRWVGGTFRAPRGGRWAIRNRGQLPIRVVALVRV
jgi:hypothetical protein